jgi:isopentenyl-diphosphate delta-isomerase
MTSGREALLVELVDESGTAIGTRTVDEAHQPPGLLHRAFSVLLVDPEGRVLLQRRAAAKTRFPLRWANSCCGHPAPGQSPGDAARIRLHEELGIDPVPLTEVGVYLYRAEDPSTGRVEYEYDHVLRGEFSPSTSVLPDPDEVADLRWMHPEELRARMATDPDAYAPWLAGVLQRFTATANGAAGAGATTQPAGAGTATPAAGNGRVAGRRGTGPEAVDAGADGTEPEPVAERPGGGR